MVDFVKHGYILAVAELRSISLAAQKCSISQPSLTKCIGKVEAQLGVKLFDRSTSPLTLTYAGERYVAQIKNICEMKYQLDREMEEICQMRKGRLTVGIPSARSTTWLPQILPPFLQKYPGMDIRIVEDITQALEESLLKEEIDLLAVSTLPITHPGLEYEEITREQLMLVVPRGHPALGGANPDDGDAFVLHYLAPHLLDGQPYVSLTGRQGLYKAGSLMFEQAGIRPQVVLETINIFTAFYLASEGLGFTVAPVSSAFHERHHTKPVYCSFFDPPAERALIAAYKKGRPLAPSARHFINTVKQQAALSQALQFPRFSVVRDLPQC